MTTDASRFLFYPVFPRIRNNSWQVLPLHPQCFWAILLSQYRRRTGSGPCTRGRRLRPPKGDFVTKYLIQFARILAICYLGEILHAVLPLPVPASVYGLVLLLVPAGSISQELKTTALVVSLATLAMGNVAFLLYDRALHNLLQVYQLVWRPKLHKMLGKR